MFEEDKYPTDPFTTLEPQNPSHNVLQLYEINRSPDAEALNCERIGPELMWPTQNVSLSVSQIPTTYLKCHPSESDLFQNKHSYRCSYSNKKRKTLAPR